MATILIPTILRRYVADKNKLNVSGNTVKEILQNIAIDYQETSRYFFNEQNEINNFLVIYLNGKHLRTASEFQTLVTNQDTIELLVSIVGG
jgi:molybdopterin converting factor small subunit